MPAIGLVIDALEGVAGPRVPECERFEDGTQLENAKNGVRALAAGGVLLVGVRGWFMCFRDYLRESPVQRLSLK